jgi:AcrR family transcriptional regulator
MLRSAPLRSAPAPAEPTPSAAAPARQRRKETRPQELLDAAMSLFAEKGFSATRAEEVAQRAGVSKGTLYLYYPSKEDLFKAVVRQNLGALIAEGLEAAEHFEGSTSELLHYLMQTWWERVGNTDAGAIHKIVIAEVRNFPDLATFYAQEVIEPAQRLFCGSVQRGIDRGEFRPLPVHEVAHALIAPMIFELLHKHSLGACPGFGEGQPDGAQVLGTHLELVLRGLEVRTEPPNHRPRIRAAAGRPAPRTASAKSRSTPKKKSP